MDNLFYKIKWLSFKAFDSKCLINRFPIKSRCYVYFVRVLVLIGTLILANHSHALSIICGAKDLSFQNHSDKVKIDYLWEEDTWEISFSAPAEIADLQFSRMVIGSEDRGLAIFLHTEKYGDEIHGYFQAREEFFQGLNLFAHYQYKGHRNQCGETIKMDLRHNKNKQNGTS